MPVLNGVIETALHVEDLPRATAFYERVLGLRLIDRSERLSVFDVSGRSILLLFKQGGTLEPVRLPGGIVPAHGGSGPLHLAFAIDAADLDGWRTRLEAQHVAIESEVTWPRGGRSLYFRDLDDHLVELATPGVWSTY